VNAVEAIRRRLLEISATADTAAGALDGAAVDFLPPELARHLAALEAVAARLDDVCERLALPLRITSPRRDWVKQAIPILCPAWSRLPAGARRVLAEPALHLKLVDHIPPRPRDRPTRVILASCNPPQHWVKVAWELCVTSMPPDMVGVVIGHELAHVYLHRTRAEGWGCEDTVDAWAAGWGFDMQGFRLAAAHFVA
jgi:hypothetical protein